MSEIVSIQQADQFVAGHSAYECGFYAVSMATSMAPLGQPPTKTPGQISDQAQAWYAQYNGDNSSSNMDGMSLDQLYSLLRQVGIHYRAMPLTDQAIALSLQSGYPVVVSIAESSVFDTELGRNPYPWTPAGNHVVVITGIHTATEWDVRDSANIAAPNTLRPGPRFYDRNKLQYVSVTAIGVTPVAQIPLGWHDDGKTLTAKNGVPVVLGFRQYVINNPWNPDNVPLKPEYHLAQLEYGNASLGGGQQQPFRDIVLEYPDAMAKVIEMWCGQEVVALQQAVANLKAQLAACQSTPPPPPSPVDYTNVKAFLDAQVTAMQSFNSTL